MVQFLALDLAGLEHILGQDPQACQVARIHPEIVHATQQMALRLMHLGEQRRQSAGVISPVRPVIALPDVGFISAFHAVIMRGIHRRVKIITADFADLGACVSRVLPRVIEPVDCGLDADPDMGTPEGDRFDILFALMQANEVEHVSITVPDQDLLR